MKALKVRTYQIVIALVLAVCGIACGQTNRVTISGLVSSDPIPQGYEVLKTDNGVMNGKAISQTLVLTKKEAHATAIISLDVTSRTTPEARLNGAKGYVAGTTESLVKAGFKVLDSRQPDLENADLDKPQVFEFVYAKPGGKKLFVQIRIFFTNIGYAIWVFGDDKEEFTALAEWVSSIAVSQ